MDDELRGPYTFWQQKLYIYKYFPSNPFSKEAGRWAYTWTEKDGKKTNKQRWISVSKIRD
jgi:hypothetical protein